MENHAFVGRSLAKVQHTPYFCQGLISVFWFEFYILSGGIAV